MQITAKLISSVTFAVLASAAVLPRQAVPIEGYTLTYHDELAATQGHDFITFGLFETAEECTAFCDSVSGCGFANSYHDVNGKGGSPLLTCSLYNTCHDTSDLTNTGGQTQPDGTINSIEDSNGWCKDVAPTDPTDPPTDPTDPPTDPTDPTDPTEPTDPTDPTDA